MFRKKIQNSMNRPSQRRSGSARLLSIVILLGITLSLFLLFNVWWFALMTSLHQISSSSSSSHQHDKSSIGSNTMTTKQPRSASDPTESVHHHKILEDFRTNFHQRYGAAAKSILEKGVQRYGDIHMTAKRMVRAAMKQEAFQLSFAGYSVTVGRGNRLEESYPLVLQKLLHPLFEQTLSIPVSVTNAAIGGIPSFPYGFCFEHFLGANTDVISWDYSMNEGNGAAVLEAYIRQSQVQLNRRPMLIVLDTNTKRCSLVQSYADRHWISEGLCVGMAKHAVPNLAQWTEELPSAERPEGFRDWDQFGAPPNCPGRGSWHPKRKEHELIAWMLAMYFVDALDVAILLMQQQQNNEINSTIALFQQEVPMFGEPLEVPPENPKSVTELLYGHLNNDSQQQRTLKHLSCRTNFLPATDQERVLPSIVVSGLANDAEADIMQVRSDDSYKSGWVLDVSEVERDTKVKVENCGGLGYIDMKIALYGIPESGTLQLWLPFEATSLHQDHDHNEMGDDMDASHWFDEIIVCEANEKRPANACQLDRDVEFAVGGVAVLEPTLIHGAAEYLKRPTCVHVGVPPGAKITQHGEIKATSSSRSNWPSTHLGLLVQITAKAPVSRRNGACCISHVVWEQH